MGRRLVLSTRRAAVCSEAGVVSSWRGWTWGSRRGRGDGAWRRAVWWAARAPDRRWAPSRCVSRRLARAALAHEAFVWQSCGSSEEQKAGRVGGAVTVRGGGRYGRRAHAGSSVGCVAARLPSIGSGGAAFVRPPFVGQSRALGQGKRRRGSTWDAAGKFRNGCNPTLRVGRREYKNCGSTTFLPILRVSSPAGSMRREAQSAAERRPARFALSLRTAQRQSDPRDCGF
jgi:hypothetical protein